MPSLSVNNSNGRFTLTLTVTETATSVSNNTSTCSWSLDLKANTAWNFTSYAIGYSVSMNGTVVGSQVRSTTRQYSIADYGTINLGKGSGVVITHADDGSLTIPVQFSIDMASADYTPGPLSSGGSITLTTIPRYSTLTVPNGTLGTAQTITVTRQSSNYTHTIKWSCGTTSGTICTASSATTFSFTPSIDLAAQNTAGASVTITFTITTTGVGDKQTSAIYTIPASVKPSVTLAVSDATGYQSTFGAYVQGWSKLAMTATPSLAYSSPITAYSISADGKTYTSTPVTTDVIQGSGTLSISAKVTDARSRTSDPATVSINVLPYTKPTVTVSAYRCNSSGAEDPEGAYMRLGFNATIASLNGKNSATYTISYNGGSGATKLTGSGTSYLSDTLPCDAAKVWSVEVTVADKLSSSVKAATIPIAFTLMDFYRTGEGVAFGKVATQDGFDCAMDAVFRGTVTFEVPPAGMASTVSESYTLPTASTTTLGGVKVDGTSVTISNGVISAAKQSRITALTSYAAGTTATSYSFTPANYSFLLMGLTPSASGAICSVAIPAALAASGLDFQVADETNYCKWRLSSTGLSRVSGAGNIRYVYGVVL